MIVPDLHIENKKTQYRFYLPDNIFEDTCLTDIRSKYNKYLFIIDDKDFKTKIIYNEDNINTDFLNFYDRETKKYIEYNNDNTIKIYTDDKKLICYVSDKNMNWYIIKMDRDDGIGTITCITEKIQDEKDVMKINEEPQKDINYNIENNENIQHDVEYDIESID
jgi:hypothetical protein